MEVRLSSTMVLKDRSEAFVRRCAVRAACFEAAIFDCFSSRRKQVDALREVLSLAEGHGHLSKVVVESKSREIGAVVGH